MAMSPFAMQLLGISPPRRREFVEQAEAEAAASGTPQQSAATRPSRPSRRVTSYHSPFQTVCAASNDDPPSYAIAQRHKPVRRRAQDDGLEALPEYTCTVSASAKVLLNLEAINPLYGVSLSDWREAFVVLRGTLLSFHRVKDHGPGKLLRSYTLQHAEIGLASDTEHTVLVPQTRLASLIPSPARRRAWQKDPTLYKPVQQHLLRLRIETDQILLGDAAEETIHALVHAIGAAIDISHAIDERTIPKQCTVPRRRRRRQRRAGDIDDPSLVAEQERIFRNMYPGLGEMERPQDDGGALTQTLTSATLEPEADAGAEALQTPTREEDDLDFAMIREETAPPPPPPAPLHQTPSSTTPHDLRPTLSRHGTVPTTSGNTAALTTLKTSPANFSPDTLKWQPPHTRTHAQMARYVRRCLPLLTADAMRASDILISNGRRVKINWRMEMLEDWTLEPPAYAEHGFEVPHPGGEEVESREGEEQEGEGTQQAQARLQMRPKSLSQSSQGDGSGSAPERGPSSVLGAEEGAGVRGEEGVAGVDFLGLSKVASREPAVGNSEAEEERREARKREERTSARGGGEELHGVVFCF